jgi:hypothetical protein
MSSSAKLVGKTAGRKVESLASEAGVKMQSEEEGDDSQNGECEICSCWSDATSPALTASWARDSHGRDGSSAMHALHSRRRLLLSVPILWKAIGPH